MISVDLALRLKAAGLVWKPASGDRFVIADRDMDAEVFVVSELTIDVHQAPTGGLLRFNGTTEWALDSIEQDAVVWLPNETQLREELGKNFGSLTPTAEGWTVTLTNGTSHEDTDAERAYARAVLAQSAR